ncbi:UNVERIFIED_ORG: hypothetical protein LHK14_22720 (plasmid) [Roseateles sp. XES5]|nr:hypothetical protein [Roseateles sp. XES5]
MALIDFRTTHNQVVYINPDHVAYVTSFEEDVSIIALAITGASGKPVVLYVRGHVELIQQKLERGPVRKTAAA